MIGVPVNWLHVGAILLCFLCLLSLDRKYLWLGGSLLQPPALRGVISLWSVSTTLWSPETRHCQLGVCLELGGDPGELCTDGGVVCGVTLSTKLNNADLKDNRNRKATWEQLLFWCDFLQQKHTESSLVLFLAHILTVTSPPWKVLLIEVLSFICHLLPGKFFFFCVKSANKRFLTFKHSQTLFPFNHYLSVFFFFVSPHIHSCFSTIPKCT